MLSADVNFVDLKELTMIEPSSSLSIRYSDLAVHGIGIHLKILVAAVDRCTSEASTAARALLCPPTLTIGSCCVACNVFQAEVQLLLH